MKNPLKALSGEETRKNPADTARVLAAAIAAAAIGALMYNVLPLYLGSMEVSKGFASSQTGLIGAAFFLGFNVAGASAFLWIRRVQWRTASILSLPVLFLALFLSDLWRDFSSIAAITVLCGFAFGISYTIGSVIIGDTSKPERWYGVKVGLESSVGAVILFLLPLTPAAKLGFQGTIIGIAACILALSPVLFLLPKTWSKEETINGSSLGKPNADIRVKSLSVTAIVCAVLSLLVLFSSVSAIWAFAERMGHLSGFSEELVGELLALTILTSIFGSLAVAVMGNRADAAKCFVGAAILIILALYMLTIKGSFPIYALGNCLYMFGWAAATPLAMAEIARLDNDGRYTSLVAPSIGLGGMIGPAAAGWLLELGGSTMVLVYVATTIIISASLMIGASRSSHRQSQIDNSIL